MRERIALALVLTGLIAWATGCKKPFDQAGFKSAINKSFAGRHECVWPEPIKLPAEADPPKTRRFAPTKPSPMPVFSFASPTKRSAFSPVPNRSINTQLSDIGHSAGDPNRNQSGYGNFCFGHFNVTAIEKATPNDPSNPNTPSITVTRLKASRLGHRPQIDEGISKNRC